MHFPNPRANILRPWEAYCWSSTRGKPGPRSMERRWSQTARPPAATRMKWVQLPPASFCKHRLNPFRPAARSPRLAGWWAPASSMRSRPRGLVGRDGSTVNVNHHVLGLEPDLGQLDVRVVGRAVAGRGQESARAIAQPGEPRISSNFAGSKPSMGQASMPSMAAALRKNPSAI